MTAGESRREAKVNSRAEAPPQHKESGVDGRAGQSAAEHRRHAPDRVSNRLRAGNKVKEKKKKR